MKLRRLALKVLLSMHRVLGTVLSLFLLMWCISGIVMIYHDFPHVGDKELPHLETLSPHSADSLMMLSRDTTMVINSLKLRTHKGEPLYEIVNAEDSVIRIDALSMHPSAGITTLEDARLTAQQWCDSIGEEKEINSLSAFLPLASYKKHFPIYRFKLCDSEKSIIYISGTNGQVVQATTASERFWSWIGPIPHYIYFWQLRQHRDAWISVVTWIGALGTLMCLSGVVIGIIMLVKTWKRRHKLRSPYKKPYYLKWHHILGLLFGLSMCLFALSGVYSLHPLPAWLTGKCDQKHDYDLQSNEPISPDSTLLRDMSTLLKTIDGIKDISVQKFNQDIFFRVGFADGYKYLSVTDNGIVQEHHLTENQIRHFISQKIDAPYSIEVMNRYDNYYSNRKSATPELPIYKVTVADGVKTTVYIAPKSGKIRVVNSPSQKNSWLYPKLHSYRFGIFANSPTLREVFIWILLVGGVALSLTGVALGVRSINRWLRRKKKRGSRLES